MRPRKPVQLTPAQEAAVKRYALALPEPWRVHFVNEVCSRLNGPEVGDAAVDAVSHASYVATYILMARSIAKEAHHDASQAR
jgi:hypothetical protein